MLTVNSKKVDSILISYYDEGFLLAVFKGKDRDFSKAKKHWGQTQQEALNWVGLLIPEAVKYNDNF